MSRRIAALAVLGAALWLPQDALAQSAMCAEPAFIVAVERVPAAQPEAPAPLRDEELPWCTGADDPRCAPLHGDSTALRLALRQPLAATMTTVPLDSARSDESAKFSACAGLVAHAGIRHRIERPPRQDR
jgi:hypothetical protein